MAVPAFPPPVFPTLHDAAADRITRLIPQLIDGWRASSFVGHALRDSGYAGLQRWPAIARGPWTVLDRILARRGSALRSAVSTMLLAATLIAGILHFFVAQESAGEPRHHGDGRHTNVTVTQGAYAAETYGDLIAQVVRQDQVGVDLGATEIDVVAITDTTGRVRAWRVQLPSTQYWGVFNNAGVNDLSADAVMTLFPALETQYEKAVLDAMHRAGVDESTAPIMFAGWSLGGMMAAKMATTPQYADRARAVVAAGSPIDMYASRIGTRVDVTQVDNLVDPVHYLEIVGPEARDTHPNWRTYWIADARVHNGTMYADGADRVVPKPRAKDRPFFADAAQGTREVVYTDRYSRN
jgi:hypothetical protein